MNERFWSKVDLFSGDCWIWLSRKRNGYGQFRHGNHSTQAHRIAYEEICGPIPQGLNLDHLCRNRSCVRPTHLEPVTQRVNTLRGETIPAAHATKTHCPKGHPLAQGNLVPWKQKNGSRVCKICKKAHDRASRVKTNNDEKRRKHAEYERRRRVTKRLIRELEAL